MDYDYTSYFWQVRKHKRTGKVLDQRWCRQGEYENEQEALADFEQDRKNHPELKWMLIKTGREVLYQDVLVCDES